LIAELHIPPTEIVYDGFVVPDYKHDRMERGKTRFEQCATCRYEPMCEGPWREYPEQLGSDEFQPVAGPRVLDGSVVLDDRFDMLGGAPPELPASSARFVAMIFMPEQGSPACTLQTNNVIAGESQLAAAGIQAVRVFPDGDTARAWRLVRDGRLRRTTY